MTSFRSILRDYLQLFRLPNLFTALADVTMGYLFVQSSLLPVTPYVAVAAASALLYTAGMVLNDVFDVEQDRRERPTRPIVAGRIALADARRVGLGLLLSGVLCGWAAGYWPLAPAALPWRAGMVASLLAVLILLYDAVLKGSVAGPWLMGGCRLLNVLLGMAAAAELPAASRFLGLHDAQLLVAGGIGVYIAGVTWFARTEAATSRRVPLVGATVVMGGGIALLGLVYRALPPATPRTLAQESTWLLLLGLLAFVIMRRCALAIVEPSAARVQLAVKNAIWSLIMLDAAVVLLICGPAWSLAIVALLIPTMLLGRRIAST